MISPDFKLRELLNELTGMDRAEIIQTASREKRAAEDFNVGRGSKFAWKRQQQIEYISDVGSFLYFVRTTAEWDMPYPEAYLNSTEYKNILRARSFED